MTQKNIRKYAKKIVEAERIVANKNSTEEEKAKAQATIERITNFIICIAGGWSVLDTLDEMIQKEFMKERGEDNNGNERNN